MSLKRPSEEVGAAARSEPSGMSVEGRSPALRRKLLPLFQHARMHRVHAMLGGQPLSDATARAKGGGAAAAACCSIVTPWGWRRCARRLIPSAHLLMAEIVLATLNVNRECATR